MFCALNTPLTRLQVCCCHKLLFLPFCRFWIQLPLQRLCVSDFIKSGEVKNGEGGGETEGEKTTLEPNTMCFCVSVSISEYPIGRTHLGSRIAFVRGNSTECGYVVHVLDALRSPNECDVCMKVYAR